jgi:hypothetical protein
VNIAEVLQQVLYELNSFLVYDPISDQFSILPYGTEEETDVEFRDGMSHFISTEKIDTPSDLSKPLKIKAFYAKLVGSKYDMVEAAVTDGLVGDRSFVTAYSDAADGQAYAQEFATELAAEFSAAQPWYEITYVGIHPIPPSTTAHTVIWRSNARGATTTILKGFPLHRPAPIPSHLFAYDGFSVAGGGLPTGEFQWQHYLMVSANQGGWDDPKWTSIIPD